MDSASVTLHIAAVDSIRSFHWATGVLVRVSYSDSTADALTKLVIEANAYFN